MGEGGLMTHDMLDILVLLGAILVLVGLIAGNCGG